MSRWAIFFGSFVWFCLFLTLALAMSHEWFFALLILFGYPHFFIAYLYQYRAGKVNVRNFVALVFFAIAGLLFIGKTSLELQAAVIGCYFLAHHFFDEFRLLGFDMNLRRAAEVLIPLTLYSVLLVNLLFGGLPVMEVAAIAVGLYALLLVAPKYFTGYGADGFTLYMWTVTLLLCSPLLFNLTIEPIVLIGIPILFHYAKWYIYSYQKFAVQERAQTEYVKLALVVNLVCIGAFALYETTPALSSALGPVFAASTFYLLAFLHISTSFFQHFARVRTTT